MLGSRARPGLPVQFDLRYSLTGQLVDVYGDHAVIRMANGTPFVVPRTDARPLTCDTGEPGRGYVCQDPEL